MDSGGRPCSFRTCPFRAACPQAGHPLSASVQGKGEEARSVAGRWVILINIRASPWACVLQLHPDTQLGLLPSANRSCQRWRGGAGAGTLVSALSSLFSQKQAVSKTAAPLMGSHDPAKPPFTHLDHSSLCPVPATRLHKQST